MNEPFEDINPWAKKLSEISIPEASESWKEMQLLLDREMPVSGVKNGIRWILLILFLLLALGICNCPLIRKQAERLEGRAIPPQKPGSREGNAGGAIPTQPDLNQGDPAITAIPGKAANGDSSRRPSLTREKNPVSSDAPLADQVNGQHPGEENGASGDSHNAKKTHRFLKSQHKKDPSSRKSVPAASGSAGSPVPDSTEETGEKEIAPIRDSVANSTRLSQPFKEDPLTKAPELLNAKKDSIKTLAKTDSLKRPVGKPPEKKAGAKDSVEDAKGFLLAIGLNQFFPVGDQRKSTLNSDGTSGGLGDYLPTPVLRYYFHKWFYLQAEAQFNTPQYTRSLLANLDTAKNILGGQDTTKMIFIKKLFYFNLPISIHFSPFKNLFVGTGIQYSILTNGVALFQDTRPGLQSLVAVQPSDTFFISAKIASFKKQPVYHELKTAEFRFLIDLNYQWKPLTAGLRYNQSFTDFVHLHISNTVITQAHNSSLQLYLRYTLWDPRRKFLIPNR